MKRYFPLLLLLVFPLSATAKEKMLNRIFLSASLTSMENGVRHLPPTLDGESRYDVLGFLVANGLTKRPGQSAIYLGWKRVIVVKGTPEDLELAGRILEFLFIGTSTTQISLGASLWNFESAGPIDLAHRPHNFAELQKMAGRSLTLLDTHTLTTSSGARVIGQNRLDPSAPEAADPQNDTAFPKGSLGSILEIEPSVDITGKQLDLQIAYQARIPQAEGQPDVTLRWSNAAATIQVGQEVVTSFATSATRTASGRFQHRALIISGEILDSYGIPKDGEEARKRIAEEKTALIRRAQEGIISP
jgi:hypothetical protein